MLSFFFAARIKLFVCVVIETLERLWLCASNGNVVLVSTLSYHFFTQLILTKIYKKVTLTLGQGARFDGCLYMYNTYKCQVELLYSRFARFNGALCCH